MSANEVIKAFDILDKFEFFGGQRAGRELWFNKPTDVQNKDVGAFLRDVDFLKDFIKSQKAELETLKAHEEKAHQYCKNVCEPKYKAEIERLRSHVNRLKQYDEKRDIRLHARLVCEAKSEARKEFAEKVKEETYHYYDSDIDDLLKEMEKEND